MVEIKSGEEITPENQGRIEEFRRMAREFSLNQMVFRRDVSVNPEFWGKIVAVGGGQVLATHPLTDSNRIPFWGEVQSKCQDLGIDARGIYVSLSLKK